VDPGFGITAYADAVEHDRLPIARWLHLGRAGGGAYDAFWQAYAGAVDLDALAESYGRLVAAAARVGLSPLALAGLLRRSPHGYRLTPRGFDSYHDLERLVTYALIEPLWAEMLAEHAADPGAAPWVAPERARTGRAWSVARRVFERAP
jgi:oxygen-independent coproporphyrinogen-3 oxidase